MLYIVLYFTQLCYFITGMGFTARKETEFSRYKNDTRPIKSRVHQRCELRNNLILKLSEN